jgi:hypothetical protein
MDTDDKLYKVDHTGAATEVGGAGGTVATGAELDTGTDNTKFASALALKNSHNVPSVAPSTSGNVLTSNGTDWTSAAPASGGASITVISAETLAVDGTFADVSFPVDTYDEIIARVRVRTANAASIDRATLRIGNTSLDWGTNYSYIAAWIGQSAGNSNSVIASGISSTIIVANGASANYFGNVEWTIYDPSDISTYRVIKGIGGHADTGTYRVGIVSGLWRNKADKVNIVNVHGVATTALKAGSKLVVLGVTYS